MWREKKWTAHSFLLSFPGEFSISQTLFSRKRRRWASLHTWVPPLWSHWQHPDRTLSLSVETQMKEGFYFHVCHMSRDIKIVEGLELTSIKKTCLSTGSVGGPLPYRSSSVWVCFSFSSICSSSRGKDFCRWDSRSQKPDFSFQTLSWVTIHLNVMHQFQCELLSQFWNSRMAVTVESAAAV